MNACRLGYAHPLGEMSNEKSLSLNRLIHCFCWMFIDRTIAQIREKNGWEQFPNKIKNKCMSMSILHTQQNATPFKTKHNALFSRRRAVKNGDTNKTE